MEYSTTFENFPRPYAAGYQSFRIFFGHGCFADMVTKSRKEAIGYIRDNGYEWKLDRMEKAYGAASDYIIRIREKSNEGYLA